MRRLRPFFSIFLFVSLWATAPCYGQYEDDLSIETEREFDEDFKERYTGERFNYEGEEVVSHTRGGSGEYEDYKKEDHPDIEEQSDEEQLEIEGPEFPFLKWLLIGILIAAVLYLIFILLNEGGAGLFSSNRDRNIVGEEELTVDNIGQIDIRSLIQKAEQSGNYRLAIRYYYLLVLKTLSTRNFIKLEDDKTNEEYYREIKSQPFSKGFSYTSYLYNYIWYGEFPINETQYHKAKGNFDNLIKNVA